MQKKIGTSFHLFSVMFRLICHMLFLNEEKQNASKSALQRQPKDKKTSK